MPSARVGLAAALVMLTTAAGSAFALTPEEQQELAQRIGAGARPQIIRLNDVMIEDYRRPPDAGDTSAKTHEFLVIRSPWDDPIELADQSFALRNLQVGGAPGPNAIYVGFSGGAQCCHTAHLIWIEGRVHQQEIPLGASDLRIEAGGGPPRLRFNDSGLSNGTASPPSGGAPEVVLAYDPRRGEYGLDADAMRKPAPSDAALADQAAEIRGKSEALAGDAPDPALSAAMLDLIYAGNAGSARALLDDAWPEAKPGKEEFLADFTHRLWAGETWRHFDLGRLLGADQAFPAPAAP